MGRCICTLESPFSQVFSDDFSLFFELSEYLSNHEKVKGLSHVKAVCCLEHPPALPVLFLRGNENDILRKRKLHRASGTSSSPPRNLFPPRPLEPRLRQLRPKNVFQHYLNNIKEIAEKYQNITVIDCVNFVPHLAEFYWDDVNLHPNDLGFLYYGNHLYKRLTELL